VSWAIRARFLIGFLGNQFARLVQAVLTGAGLIVLVMMLSTNLQADSRLGFVLFIPA